MWETKKNAFLNSASIWKHIGWFSPLGSLGAKDVFHFYSFFFWIASYVEMLESPMQRNFKQKVPFLFGFVTYLQYGTVSC